MTKKNGFTLLELMVTISIIGILASIAIPNYQGYIDRAKLSEAITMADFVRTRVTHYHSDALSFPVNNEELGLPPRDKLIGNTIAGVDVENGAVHITIGNKVAKSLDGKILTFRPAMVIDSPISPIAWLCGYDEAVPGMEAVGTNRTDIPRELLPQNCR